MRYRGAPVRRGGLSRDDRAKKRSVERLDGLRLIQHDGWIENKRRGLEPNFKRLRRK